MTDLPFLPPWDGGPNPTEPDRDDRYEPPWSPGWERDDRQFWNYSPEWRDQP